MIQFYVLAIMQFCCDHLLWTIVNIYRLIKYFIYPEEFRVFAHQLGICSV